MWSKRLRWAAALGSLLASATVASRLTAQEPGAIAQTAGTRTVIASTNPASIGRPVPSATIERPVPVVDSAAPPVVQAAAPPPAPPLAKQMETVSPVDYQEPGLIVRGQAPQQSTSLYGPPPVAPPTGDVPAPPFGAPEGGYIPGAPYDHPLPRHDGVFDHIHDWFGSSGGGHGNWCESDHTCDCLATPVSNPFFFEDPRAVTEIRPLLIIQDSPNRAPFFNGGNSYFYGIQGRVAFNDRWSLVINKLGFVTFDPNNPGPEIERRTGFAEVNIGPKYTFLHNTSSGTVAAVGVNFDIPFGSREVLQDTGSLSIDPYFTIGQTFGRTSWGVFDFIGTIGYNFSVDDARSDFFHTALHLDFNVAAANKWYPLIELNWFHYTDSGKAHDFGPNGLEGLDLGNFGSTNVSGRDFVSLATGVRYKLNEHVQFGAAVEFPLTRAQDIQDFRVVLDMIFRY
jgi:hypothetical protein